MPSKFVIGHNNNNFLFKIKVSIKIIHMILELNQEAVYYPWWSMVIVLLLIPNINHRHLFVKMFWSIFSYCKRLHTNISLSYMTLYWFLHKYTCIIHASIVLSTLKHCYINQCKKLCTAKLGTVICCIHCYHITCTHISG